MHKSIESTYQKEVQNGPDGKQSSTLATPLNARLRKAHRRGRCERPCHPGSRYGMQGWRVEERGGAAEESTPRTTERGAGGADAKRGPSVNGRERRTSVQRSEIGARGALRVSSLLFRLSSLFVDGPSRTLRAAWQHQGLMCPTVRPRAVSGRGRDGQGGGGQSARLFAIGPILDLLLVGAFY